MGELVSFGTTDDGEFAIVWFSSKKMHVCFYKPNVITGQTQTV